MGSRVDFVPKVLEVSRIEEALFNPTPVLVAAIPAENHPLGIAVEVSPVAAVVPFLAACRPEEEASLAVDTVEVVITNQ